ncbi:hypothetical protein CCR75_002363 [Bremia lactucae]|uniref:SWIRM domain-containing protein n=1 Tax=Bremia lactucae TaxID=4779 RepID=A0A976FNE7_BRELC|nr:hypothetical protein CCR75_002363 [Bremia lactucae]
MESSSSSAAAAAATTSASTPSSSSAQPFKSTIATSTTASASHMADSDPQTDPDDFEGSKAIAVPRCSTWFAMDKINPIEKRMLPEFFTNHASKTAELYLKYRNYMVHAYRQQPGVYLTATACRRNLAGDACAILRVHEFLTHWGLINFHVPPHAMPPTVHSNYALKTVESTALNCEKGPVAMLVAATQTNNRHANVPLACEACGAPRNPDDSFFELPKEIKTKWMSHGAATSATPMVSSSIHGKSSESKEVTIHGFALRPGSGICEECYIRGAYPEGYEASDFVLMPQVGGTSVSKTAQWSLNETNALLEAVSSTRKDASGDEHGNCDWNYVASKVGTKTAEECLVHFLELPMLEEMLPRHGKQLQQWSQEGIRPYYPGSALNAPVLDLVALVEGIDPAVAQAAAYAAISAIQRLHLKPIDSDIKVETTQSVTPASSTLLDAAADAVVTSAETAGIKSTIKSEDSVGDTNVVMEDVTGATDSAGPHPAGKAEQPSVSKELLAVTEETANATTVALVATRAQAIADETDTGPVRDLVNQLLENQLRQMELKMEQLTVLEQTVVAQKEQLAREKYQLYIDRLAFSRDKLKGRAT